MCCYFGCLKSWGLCEHGFDWLENTMPHGGWWRLSISFLFKALVPPGNAVSYTSPQAPVTLPCQPPACQSPLLTRPCSFPLLSVHVFRDLFSLFILMLRILITHLQDPQHLYLIKVFFFSPPSAHIIASFRCKLRKPPQQIQDRKWNSQQLQLVFSSQKLTLLKAKKYIARFTVKIMPNGWIPLWDLIVGN